MKIKKVTSNKMPLLAMGIIIVMSQVALANPWQTKILLIGNKNEYQKGERIVARCIIKNLGDQKDVCWVEKVHGIMLVNSKADTFFTDCAPAGWQEITLGTNEIYEAWPMIEEALSKKTNGDFLPPDNYSIYILIKYKDASGIFNKACSETLHFKVVDPNPQEIQAYRMYAAAMNMGGMRKRDFYPGFMDIVKKYPHSVYAPSAYDLHIMIQGWKSKSKTKTAETCEDLIMKYPDYPRIYWVISTMIDSYRKSGRGELIVDKLKSIQKKAPKATTNVLNDALDEWLVKLKKSGAE